jgi:spermidine/putrescine transport system permease protein
MARRGVNPKINALSTIMFITVLILLLIVNKRMDKDNFKAKESVR